MAARPLRGLALCAGAGGLELGLRLALPGYRTVGYVERDAYAAATLVARMADEALDDAPVWDDLDTFDARPWRGAVDLISAGFPCPPFSQAGRRRGTDDDRWLWPGIARVVREVGPSLVFLENVRGLLAPATDQLAGLGHVLRDLALLGFDAEWSLLGAAHVGAPHQRDRVFVLAHATGVSSTHVPGRSAPDATHPLGRPEFGPSSRGGGRRPAPGARQPSRAPTPVAEDVADADGGRRLGFGVVGVPRHAHAQARYDPDRCSGPPLADADGTRREGPRHRPSGQPIPARGGPPLDAPFPPGPDDWDAWAEVLAVDPSLEPSLYRMADGMAHRLDRLRLTGNGVVPLVAAHALLSLAERLECPCLTATA